MRLKTSVIIPHRDRNDNLAMCLASLHMAVRYGGYRGADPPEIIVVDGGSVVVPNVSENMRVVRCPADNPFNKAKLLNVGIAQSSGDLLTFLDADAIVAPGFLAAPLRIWETFPAVTKVAYRVRYLEPPMVRTFAATESVWEYRALFYSYRWSAAPVAKEAYEAPHRFSNRNRSNRATPVFGNSQQTVPRWVLGDTRFDEEYAGRGFEDIDFNLSLWEYRQQTYTAVILTRRIEAMYHVRNQPLGGHWGERHHNIRNRTRYMTRFGQLMRRMGGNAKTRRR